MARTPARSKQRNDAHVKTANAKAPAVSNSDFGQSPPRSKKSGIERDKRPQGPFDLSPYAKQSLLDHFDQLLAPLRSEQNQALDFPEFIAANTGLIGILAARTLLSLDTLESLTVREVKFLTRMIADCAVGQMDALATRRAKQIEPLERNRAKGALRNKQRAADARTQFRQMARDLWCQNPTWSVKTMVQHIHRTAGKVQGHAYSAATIGHAIKGVREECRTEFEVSRKKTGLYTPDR